MMLWMWPPTESSLVIKCNTEYFDWAQSVNTGDDWWRFELAFQVLVREQYLHWLGSVECEIILSWPSFYIEQFCASGVNILRWDDDVSIICVFTENVARSHVCSQIRSTDVIWRRSDCKSLNYAGWYLKGVRHLSTVCRAVGMSTEVRELMQPASCPGCQAWRRTLH